MSSNIDSLIHTEVMHDGDPPVYAGQEPPTAPFSTDMNHTMDVLEKLKYTMPIIDWAGCVWQVDLIGEDSKFYSAADKSLPMAICLAALNLKGIKLTLLKSLPPLKQGGN